MKINQLKIQNFRGIKEGTICFDDHTVLVGANNVGKTCVIEALTLLFGRDRLIRSLSEHDFYGATPSPKDRFTITAQITDFEDNNPESNYNWFRKGRAVPKWLNPNDNTTYTEQSDSSWMLCAEIGISGRFDTEDLTVETVRFFVDSESFGDPFDDENYIEKFPISLLKETGFFLVPASRTWDKMLSFASELFRRVVSTVGSIPALAILNQRDQVRYPEIKIEEQKEIKEVFDAVNNELSIIFPNAPKSHLRLTNTNSESVLTSLIPHFSSLERDLPIPSNRQGSGVVSMQNLLLLLQLGELRKRNSQSFIVAIEEPELHIPPSQQRRLTNRLKACCQQTIVSTHSPDVASEFEPQSIRVLEKDQGILEAKPLINKRLSTEETNPVRHLIQWQKRQAIDSLMHERLLIPEGKGDYNWLKLLSSGLEACSEHVNQDSNLFSCLIGVFPTESAAVEKVFNVLSNSHANAICLVDGDKEGLRYIEVLKNASVSPKRILKWHDNATIEDIIGLLLNVEKESFLPKIKELIGDDSIKDIDGFVSLLKLQRNKNNNGRKDDYLLHNDIVRLIFTSEKGIEAVSNLFAAIIDATDSKPKEIGFIINSALSNDTVKVFEYKP